MGKDVASCNRIVVDHIEENRTDPELHHGVVIDPEDEVDRHLYVLERSDREAVELKSKEIGDFFVMERFVTMNNSHVLVASNVDLLIGQSSGKEEEVEEVPSHPPSISLTNSPIPSSRLTSCPSNVLEISLFHSPVPGRTAIDAPAPKASMQTVYGWPAVLQRHSRSGMENAMNCAIHRKLAPS